MNRKKVTPRDVKIGLREGEIYLMHGNPPPPSGLSKFQQGRVSRSVTVTLQYLRLGLNMQQLAERQGVTHQRVTQLLQIGIDYLFSRRHLRFGANPAANPGSPSDQTATQGKPTQLRTGTH